MIKDKELLLVSNLDTELNVICGGTLSFLFEVESLPIGSKRPLISFEFKNKNGEIIRDINCSKVGIVLSSYPEIGYYRYISTVNKLENEITLRLPSSVYSIKIKVWPRGHNLRVENLRIIQK